MPVALPTNAVVQDDEVGLAWWNTSLSPNKKKGLATDDHLTAAARIVDELIGAGAVLIGFCEVAEGDLEYLSANSGLVAFERTVAGSVAGRASTFDTSIAFDPHRLRLVEAADVLGAYGGGQLRVGQRFAFEPLTGGDLLHVIISHWPSRQTLGPNDPKRVMYGHILRETLSHIQAPDGGCQIVLMGDYNDEPFSDSIHVSLRATRDRERSKARNDVLYNPFWRHMASFEHDGHHPCSDQGTYFYKSGDVTRWHTFDQMMFSNSLLVGTRGWQMDESRTRAFSPAWLDELLLSSQSKIDHRPIVGLLKRA